MKWAKGTPNLNVSLSPHGLGITVKDGPLTISDSGHLANAAKKWQDSPLAAATELLTGDTKTQKLRTPITAELAISSAKVPVKAGAVEVEAHFTVGGDAPTVEVTVSSTLKGKIPPYGAVTADFSITADMRLDPNFRLNNPFDQAAAVAALLAAIALAARTKGSGGQPRLPGLAPRLRPSPPALAE